MIERADPHYRLIPGAIILRGGDANFNTPPHIRDAAIKAIIDGYVHYPPTEGIPEIREALVKYYSKYGVEYDPSQVYITPGGGAALNLANVTFLESGDEALVFDPSFSRYFSMPPYLNAKIVPVPLTEPGYHFDPEELKKRVTDKSKIREDFPLAEGEPDEDVRGVSKVRDDDILAALEPHHATHHVQPLSNPCDPAQLVLIRVKELCSLPLRVRLVYARVV